VGLDARTQPKRRGTARDLNKRACCPEQGHKDVGVPGRLHPIPRVVGDTKLRNNAGGGRLPPPHTVPAKRTNVKIEAVELPQAPSEFDGTLDELYEKYMLPVMPSVDAVEHIHQHLLRIAESGISTLSIRYERKEDMGKVRPVNDGTTIRWTDNAPAWGVHRAAFENKRWSTADFDAFIQSLPVRMFEAPRPSVRDAGYYVAHLLGVKNSPASAVDLSPDDRLVRFMRNVHPMNHFYVPNRTKGTGHRYGEDPTVIAFIAAEYEKRFGGLWRQFIRMTAGERLRAMTGVGSMRVSFHTGNEGQARVEHGVKATSADSDYSLTTGKLCTPIVQTDLIPPFRSWCGDDEKGHNRHNGTVRLSESPLQIIVRWRRSLESSTKLVGCYRLDLDALLAEGYIRSDKTPGEVRLQFVHEGGSIYIQHLPARRLRVGCFL